MMEQEKQKINKDVLEQYRDAWSKHDPTPTGFIEIGKLTELMYDIEKPLGWGKSIKNSPTRQALFLKLMTQNMPTYNDHTQYHFSDVLDNITLIYVIRKEIEKQVVGQDFSSQGTSNSESGGSSDEDDDDSYDSSGYGGGANKRSSNSSESSSDSNRPDKGKIEVAGTNSVE